MWDYDSCVSFDCGSYDWVDPCYDVDIHHHYHDYYVPSYGAVGGFGGLIGGFIGGAIGANMARGRDKEVIVIQQPQQQPHTERGDVHVHVNQYTPPTKSYKTSSNAKPTQQSGTNRDTTSSPGPAIQQIESGLASLEKLMHADNVSAAKLQAPAFKKWYLQEREKFTDINLLGVYDTRMLTIDMWLLNAESKVVKVSSGSFTEKDARNVFEQMTTKNGQKKVAHLFHPEPITDENTQNNFVGNAFMQSLRNMNIADQRNPPITHKNPMQAYPGLGPKR